MMYPQLGGEVVRDIDKRFGIQVAAFHPTARRDVAGIFILIQVASTAGTFRAGMVPLGDVFIHIVLQHAVPIQRGGAVLIVVAVLGGHHPDGVVLRQIRLAFGAFQDGVPMAPLGHCCVGLGEMGRISTAQDAHVTLMHAIDLIFS